MSVKRSKLALPTSTQIIRKARISLRKMSNQRKIELMVQAGIMTQSQADRVIKKLAEAQNSS
jgi:hypothetical protein